MSRSPSNTFESMGLGLTKPSESQGKGSHSRLNDGEMFSFQPYKWTRLKPRSSCEPPPVSGHRIVYIDGKIYLFGGYNNDEAYSNDNQFPNFPYLWRYNVASNMWKQVTLCATATFRCRRTASFTATALKFHGHDTLMMYGGTRHPFGTELSSSITLLDAETATCWEDFPRLERGIYDVGDENDDDSLYPPAVYGQASIFDPAAGAFYVVGGTQGLAYFMNVHRLNLCPGEWEALYVRPPDFEHPDAPTPRYRSELAFLNNKIYLFGGVYWDKIFGYEDMFTFDVVTKEWTNNRCKPYKLNDELIYPPEVKFHSILQLGQYAYLIGGTSLTDVNFHLWRMDLTDFSWTLLPFTQETPTYFGSCAITPEGRAFSFGGIADVKTPERVNQLSSVWLKIPSLREMVWAVITNRYQNLNELSRNKLLELGIPLDLVERVDYCQPAV